MPLLFSASNSCGSCRWNRREGGQKNGRKGRSIWTFQGFLSSSILGAYGTGGGEELSFAFTFAGAFPRVWLIIYCKNPNKVGLVLVFNEWTSS